MHYYKTNVFGFIFINKCCVMKYKIKPEFLDFQPPNYNCKFGELSQSSIQSQSKQWIDKYCVKTSETKKKKKIKIEDL